MTKILLDVNVWLDYLLSRTGKSEAIKLISAINSNQLQCLFTPIQAHILSYYCKKIYTPVQIRSFLLFVNSTCLVVDSTKDSMLAALQVDVVDLEDEMLLATVASHAGNILITSDKALLKRSGTHGIQIITPVQAVALFQL